MNLTFTQHDTTTAPLPSQALLRSAQNAYGFIPNLFASMAESPALLEGYMNLYGIFNKTALSEMERQVIMMTANRLHGCNYCMAAHTAIALGSKVNADVVQALREGTSLPDLKLEALRQFTIVVLESRGWPNSASLDALFSVGYTRETVLEVILGVSLKVMSNYTNHIAQTPLDAVFQGYAWQAKS